MTDKTYDVLCTVQRWLYALGTLYLGLAAIWTLPFGDEVNKTVAVIGTFLAAVIEAEKAKWSKSHAISITEFKKGAKKE